MFHIELRQFPHNAWRFNLHDSELQAIAGRWVRGEVLEIGERRWNPQQARITIVEGPELAMAQLTMGRGWRTAQREGRDVTERVLVALRTASGCPPSSRATPAAPASEGDALGLAVQLGSLLGADAGRLLEAWRGVATRAPQLAPSESLAQAERELRGG